MSEEGVRKVKELLFDLVTLLSGRLAESFMNCYCFGS